MGNVPPFVDRDDLELAEDGSGPEERRNTGCLETARRAENRPRGDVGAC